ncbi:MAG TPA: C4-type zinc ribbon domain-containing protein [Thermoanaerobaculia bacterium]|nr:C4-type zinc ribbon domain-containing protein [Thermoanaerobaculia bacterium]
MTDLLDQLYRLQTRIRFVQENERRRDTVPEDLVEVDREFQEKVQTVAALKARLTEAELEKRKADGELGEHKEKLKKYQGQLRSVQSSREYSAALNEIDGVEKLIRTTEDRFLELEEEIEKARAELTEREATLPAETEQHEERMKDWRAEQRAINEQLTAAREEIARLEAEVPPRDRAEFRRLIDKKHGLAVALVVNGSCSACHVKIRPAALQILKQGREIVYCDTCKRILYYEPASS